MCEYVAQFDDCVKGNPNRQHLRTYLEGQLGPLPRKRVEPIAPGLGPGQALELLQRSLDEGVQFKWLTADEEYGRVSDFRHTVAKAGLLYMMEIPRDLTEWLRRPKIEAAGTVTRSGYTLSKDRVAPGQPEAQPVWQIWNNSRLPWELYRVKDTEKEPALDLIQGPCVWRVRQTRFFPHEDGLPGERLRLIEAQSLP